MSCGPCEDKKRQQKGMSRGEFLGVGAAAAAGLGTVGMEVGAAAPQTGCRKPDACGDSAPKRWEVSASVVQVIWGELLPRLMAYKWRTGAFPAPLAGLHYGTITADDLIECSHRFLSDPQGGGSVLSCALNGTTNRFTCTFSATLTRFEKRIQILTEKLKPAAGGSLGPMPIRLMEASGFDFVLSNDGMDIFVPTKPRNAFELLRFYQIRQSGRSTIGVPAYMDGPDALALDVQSPVGPSQVFATDLTPVIGGSCTLRDLMAGCLDTVGFDPPYRLPREGGHPITFSIRSYLAATGKFRCWQLEGSVYRGILEQLPRVVATVWREQLQSSCTPADPQSYANRWNATDLRDIFRERLETSLPDQADMVFRPEGSVTGPNPLTDVMISNQGLHFPPLPAAPNLQDMFGAIAAGTAGNPVFTDTRRPPRDE